MKDNIIRSSVIALFMVAGIALLFGERLYYTIQGYYVVTGFDGAHLIADRILDKELSEDECLKIKYLKDKLLPDYLTDATMQEECLSDIAEARDDPMVCTKMPTSYAASTCGSDLYGGILISMQYDSLTEDRYLCDLNEKTDMVECQYYQYGGDPDRPDLKPEQFPLEQCSKFSLEQSRDWCNYYRTDSVDDCGKLRLPYFRERCYLFLDQDCDRSSNPDLQVACKVLQTIEERFKNEPNRRNGNFF